MSVVPKKTVQFKLNGKEVSAPEGMVIIEAAKRNGVEISNLCYNRKLKPFAACRTCMVEMQVNGKKELVYSCTQPVADGIEVKTNTDETDRYNKSCLEMLLVEHPLDCPICDKSGVCPLQDTTDLLQQFNARFEIQRRNEPSIKTNPIIEFYLNRCILCGLCVRACDEIQGAEALDFHQRGMKSVIGTANEEPLDCEFCGQCITVCPTGALMDMTSQARGLAALFNNTYSTCNFCSWGCTVRLQTKQGKVIRIEADEGYEVGINEGNLCAKGRFGHGMIHNEKRIQTPLMNYGGTFKEVTWTEAIQTIAERFQATVNRSGPGSIAGLGGEKLTNEENYLFQKLFRNHFGSNEITNLANLRAPFVNRFMVNCFENGITSKPVTELDEADVVLIFNSDLPSEYPVGGNSIRKGANFVGTDIIIANPRQVQFEHNSERETRLKYTFGADAAVVNRINRILIDTKLVDADKIKSAVPNYDDLVQSLAPYTAEAVEKLTGLSDDILTQAAERFGRNADRFVIIGNDILENGQGEDTLNALLNLATLVHHGGEGSVSIYPPREHCNSQGVNDMGVTPDFLPGYRSPKDPAALDALGREWDNPSLKLNTDNLSRELFENCINGRIKLLYVAGEDPVHSFYKGSQAVDALRTVPFLVVQDIYMTETAKMADIVLPASSYAEKEGTFTNMTRHVQRVAPAILSEGSSRPDFDIFCDLAEALGKPFKHTAILDVQDEIQRVVSIYQGVFPGNKSRQWVPSDTASNPRFHPTGPCEPPVSNDQFTFKLLTNNHMFHIGNYSQHAKALTDIGANCVAGLHPSDAKGLGLETGDRIVVASATHQVELPVEVTPVTAPGMVYIPKNWVDIPVNLLRNGDEGLISVKVAKAAG